MTIVSEPTPSIIQVVLADDHAIVRAGIRLFLEQASDIKVIAEASDGEMAVGMIERSNLIRELHYDHRKGLILTIHHKRRNEHG